MSIADRRDVTEHAVPLRLGLAPVRRRTRYERLVKPVLDRLCAAILLVLLAPVLAGTALVVFARLGSPILIRQQRVGLGGRRFAMLKFRTMRPCRRERGLDYVGPERRVRHKSPDDPRLDPVGRVLRALSLDELPQLFNILRGDMSMVGPRPELVEIVETKYEPWQHGRHVVKPGLTGLWQVTARADTDTLMHQLTDIDLRYALRVSWRTDLAILLRTVPVLLGRQRGY